MTTTNRRGFLATTGAGALLSASALAGCSPRSEKPATTSSPVLATAAASTTRTRHSATSPEGRAMLSKYATAVERMMSRPPSDPTSWEFQWYTHWLPGPQAWAAAQANKAARINSGFAQLPANDPKRALADLMWSSCQAHSADPADPEHFRQIYFLPWHRLYVYYFEEIIRATLQDESFALPFWDYLSGNVADLSMPAEFRDSHSPLYRSQRNPWVNNGDRIDLENPGSLNLGALGQAGFVGMSAIIDGNPHGMVHGMIGNSGNMGSVPTAAGDPIFWLHHCNIDRLWASWTPDGQRNPSWAPRRFDFADRQGVHASRAGDDAKTTDAVLGYTYSSPARLPTPTPSTGPSPLVGAGAVSATIGEGPSISLTSSMSTTKVKKSGNTAPAPFDAAAASQYYLVLENLVSGESSSTTFNVFAGSGTGASRAAGDPGYVGSFGLFNSMPAAGHDAHPQPHGITLPLQSSSARALLAGDREIDVQVVARGDRQLAGNPSIGAVKVTASKPG